jgi:hypothetical protein
MTSHYFPFILFHLQNFSAQWNIMMKHDTEFNIHPSMMFKYLKMYQLTSDSSRSTDQIFKKFKVGGRVTKICQNVSFWLKTKNNNRHIIYFTYISILNATYYLVTFLSHYMFWPYTAIIRCLRRFSAWHFDSISMYTTWYEVQKKIHANMHSWKKVNSE